MTKQMYRALALRQSEWRDYESCVICTGRGGAMPLVEKWWYEHMNKLVEREVFIVSTRIQGEELENN